jgi:hypothetical protein
MQIVLFRVAKLGASTSVKLMKDEKVQVRATNKIRGDLGSTIDVGELNLLRESDFFASLASLPLG